MSVPSISLGALAVDFLHHGSTDYKPVCEMGFSPTKAQILNCGWSQLRIRRKKGSLNLPEEHRRSHTVGNSSMHAVNKCSISCPPSTCQHYLASARGISGPWHPPTRAPGTQFPHQAPAVSLPCHCCISMQNSPLLSQAVRRGATSCALHQQLGNLGKLESSAAISHYPRKRALSCTDQKFRWALNGQTTVTDSSTAYWNNSYSLFLLF